MPLTVQNISYADAARQPFGSIIRPATQDHASLSTWDQISASSWASIPTPPWKPVPTSSWGNKSTSPWNQEPTTQQPLPPYYTNKTGTNPFTTIPLEIFRNILDSVLEPPCSRTVVYAQPPSKWHRYFNTDFSHGVYGVNKSFRHHAITQLLNNYTVNFDDTNDIAWLEGWANKYGIEIDITRHIRKVMFIEFDRYGQHAELYAFLQRLRKTGRLFELTLRFSIRNIADFTHQDMVKTYCLEQLRSMRGLKKVKVHMCQGWRDVDDNPVLWETQQWLREEMCKAREKGAEEEDQVQIVKHVRASRIVPALPDWSKLVARMRRL